MAIDDRFYFRMCFREFLADGKVTELTNSQIGTLIIAWCLAADTGSIPTNERAMRKVLRVEPGEDVSFLTRMGFFLPEGDRLFSPRMREEMAHRESRREACSNAGKRSAAVRQAQREQELSEGSNGCSTDVATDVERTLNGCTNENSTSHSHSQNHSQSHNQNKSPLNTPVENPSDYSTATGGKVALVVKTWNRITAGKLPKAKVTPKRERVIRARLKEPGWMSDFERACSFLTLSDFHLGKNDRGWTADIDFLLRADKAQSLAEKATAQSATPKSTLDSIFG